MRRDVSRRLFLPIFLVGCLAWVAWPISTGAGALTGLRDYLVRQQGELTSGQTHQIFFIPATSLAGSANTVVLSFPIEHSGEWCRTAGADLVVNGLVDPEGANEAATSLPGTLAAACAQGNNATFGDTITVSGVGPLSAAMKYGVSVSGGSVAKLGTPPAEQNILVTIKTTDGVVDIDSAIFWLAVGSNDRVTISAVVSAAPPPATTATVQFKGRASVGTDVHFHRDTVDDPPLLAVPTDAAAKFDVTLTDQPTGQHIYTVQAQDSAGRPHTSLTFALNLTAGSTTIISGVFLGPSIDVDKDEVKLGETVTVFGKTAPGSTVTLTVNSAPKTYTLTADSGGNWSKAVPTNEVGTGTHTAVATAVSTDNTVSEDSPTANFVVNPLQPCDGKARADLNCDGRVNLTDFSILLFFWQQTSPSNARSDINADGRVTIVDFSILLYQWSG